MGRKLYVGNFPYETGEAELQELFARAGTVETVKVMRDMATGRPRGFAFVEMSSDEEAQKAIADTMPVMVRHLFFDWDSTRVSSDQKIVKGDESRAVSVYLANENFRLVKTLPAFSVWQR